VGQAETRIGGGRDFGSIFLLETSGLFCADGMLFPPVSCMHDDAVLQPPLTHPRPLPCAIQLLMWKGDAKVMDSQDAMFVNMHKKRAHKSE
jgi:hypothetical protein